MEIRDIRDLCRHSQLELSEPDTEAILPNIFGHCEVKCSERQYCSGCIGSVGLCEGGFEEKKDTDGEVKVKDE